jgi:transposase
MLNVVDIEYIRRKHYIEGWSIRKISRQLEVSRPTIRKALESAEPWHYTLTRGKPCPVMDPYKDIIVSWLELDGSAPAKQRHTAKRIYDRLCQEHGFGGADSTVRYYVRKLRWELGGITEEPFIPLMADPGEMAQVDWGEARIILNGQDTEVHLFCMRLRASSVPYVWAARHERFEAFLEGHVRAFEWFGGVSENLVYDNLTTAVRKVLSGHNRELQERFITLRSHYLFQSVFCNIKSGNEKGSVENLVGYVRRNALTPVPSVYSMAELNNDVLLGWCHKEQERLQADWFVEKASLRGIPEGIYKPCISVILPVNKLSLVTYERNRYSIPTRYISLNVRMDAYTDRLEMWHQDQLIARHQRQYGRNHTSLQLEHYLDALALKPYAVNNAVVVRELPEPYQQARKFLCGSNQSGYREFVRILLLHKEFPAQQVRVAVADRLAAGGLTSDEVRQVILNQRAEKSFSGAVVVPDMMAQIQVPVGKPRLYDELMEVEV